MLQQKKKLVEMQNITKVFGKVKANTDVSLTLHGGEIHSLLGENGAGKSTLMNILSGLYQPDSGFVFVEGRQVDITSPKTAIGLGIGMVHQHFKLVDVLSAKENIIAGQKGFPLINGKKISEEIRYVSERYGLEIDPDKKIYDMSVAEKQRVEILKVLYSGARILILDEPTAVLTPQETRKLFEIIRRMRDNGCAVVIITHKLAEVLEISDRITILRKGRYYRTVKNKDLDSRELTDMMVGKSMNLSINRPETRDKKALLRVSGLTVKNEEQVKVLKNVSFDLSTGEVLGVAGVAGSGQKELCEAIAGLQKVHSGKIKFDKSNLVGKSPREIIRMGISMSFVPEDRLGMGLIASMDIVDNVLLKEYQGQKGPFLSKREARIKAADLVEKLNISTPDIHTKVSMLSGGNIQKVLLGREIEIEPQLMITAYPARGLDIGSAHLVYDLINEQKKKGVAVLFIGEDLDVLIEMCDRIMVLCAGEVVGILDGHQATKEDLGYMMAGNALDKGVEKKP